MCILMQTVFHDGKIYRRSSLACPQFSHVSPLNWCASNSHRSNSFNFDNDSTPKHIDISQQNHNRSCVSFLFKLLLVLYQNYIISNCNLRAILSFLLFHLSNYRIKQWRWSTSIIIDSGNGKYTSPLAHSEFTVTINLMLCFYVIRCTVRPLAMVDYLVNLTNLKLPMTSLSLLPGLSPWLLESRGCMKMHFSFVRWTMPKK